MKGFDKEFRDLPDYIIRITEKIWEGRDVAAVGKYYGETCPVRSPAGVVVGAEKVIAATLATLAEFPDRQLLPEEVVWSGDAESGFLSSHRIFSTATHNGNGAYGAATGKRLRYRIIADCVVRGNRVVEEWLVRDQGAIARCLGMNPRQMAQMQIAAGDGGFFTPETDVAGSYQPRFSEDADAAAYMELAQTLRRGGLSSAGKMYRRAAVLHAPGGADYHGVDEIDGFWLGWLAAFAAAEFRAEELTATENENGKTVAMRWSVRGEHSGGGLFAAPQSGAPLYVMGISHARFAGGKIAEEWMLVDEVPLWKQILTAGH